MAQPGSPAAFMRTAVGAVGSPWSPKLGSTPHGVTRIATMFQFARSSAPIASDGAEMGSKESPGPSFCVLGVGFSFAFANAMTCRSLSDRRARGRCRSTW